MINGKISPLLKIVSVSIFFLATANAFADTHCILFDGKELPYTEPADTHQEHPFQMKMCFERNNDRNSYIMNYFIAPYDSETHEVVGSFRNLISHVKYEVTGRARCLCELGDMVETKDPRVVGSDDIGILARFAFNGGTYASGTINFSYNSEIYSIPYVRAHGAE